MMKFRKFTSSLGHLTIIKILESLGMGLKSQESKSISWRNSISARVEHSLEEKLTRPQGSQRVRELRSTRMDLSMRAILLTDTPMDQVEV